MGLGDTALDAKRSCLWSNQVERVYLQGRITVFGMRRSPRRTGVSVEEIAVVNVPGRAGVLTGEFTHELSLSPGEPYVLRMA